MHIRGVWSAAVAAALLAVAAPHAAIGDEQKQAGATSAPEQLTPSLVVSKMHHANDMEIRLGEMAQRKGSWVKVQRYGDRLVRDHRNADQRVLALARGQNLEITAIPPTEEQQYAAFAVRPADVERRRLRRAA